MFASRFTSQNFICFYGDNTFILISKTATMGNVSALSALISYMHGYHGNLTGILQWPILLICILLFQLVQLELSNFAMFLSELKKIC